MSNKDMRKDLNKPIFFGQLKKGIKVNVKDTILMKVFARSMHNWDSFGSGTAFNLVDANIGPIEAISEENDFVVLTTNDEIIFCKYEDEKDIYYGVIFEDAEPKTAIKVVGLYTDEYCYNNEKRLFVKDFVPDEVISDYPGNSMYIIRFKESTFCCVRVYPILI